MCRRALVQAFFYVLKSMYQVLARKYRPKNFSELVGQHHVQQALHFALSEQRLHHAYLLTGTRGVGKTTIARIFAKSINCLQNGISAYPCGECEHCREIDSGRFPDLIEIDAASRTGVDDTREILDNVPYSPIKGRFKVYLIDEVHMFSKSSFNALLKTLEEPPAHVKFILATTDPQKLPITIVSRCLQFHLKNMSESEIAHHLKAILEKEALIYEWEALLGIASSANGSMRDALSLLDQVIVFGQGAVKMNDVMQLLGSVPSAKLHELILNIATQKPQALRQTLFDLEAFAPDYSLLVQKLLYLVQLITVVQLNAQRVGEEIPPFIQELAPQLPMELVQLWYQILSDTWQSLPHQPDARLCVEMGLLRLMAFRPAHLPAVQEAPADLSVRSSPLTPSEPPKNNEPSPPWEEAETPEERFSQHPEIRAVVEGLGAEILEVKPE